MSWLSKTLGGKTLKIGAAILGSTVAKDYLFGATSGGQYDPNTFTGSAFNKLGITPFRDTGVGSFLAPYLDKGKDIIGFGTELADGSMRSLQFGDLPTMGRVGYNPVNTNTNFQAGRAGMIPLGNSGRVNSALANPNVQMYLAKRARMVGLPAINTATPTVTTKATLSPTTSRRRRARTKLIG